MRRLIALLMGATMVFSLCACESKEEKALRSAQTAVNQAQKEYEDAVRKHNDLQRDIEAYEKAIGKLK